MRKQFLVHSRGHQLIVPDLDVTTLALYTYDVYESAESRIIEQIVRPGSNFVDVGASVGHYSLLAARLVKNEGTVFAFESNPTTFEVLQSNIQLNGYENIKTYSMAVSWKKGYSLLWCSGEIMEEKTDETQPWIETTTLDDILSTISRPVDFIKLDIDGQDPWVWKGMKNILEHSKSLNLLIEFSPGDLRRVGNDPVEYLQTIQGEGFRLYGICRAKIMAMFDENNNFLRLEEIERGGFFELKNFKGLQDNVGDNVINLLCLRDTSVVPLIKEPFLGVF